MEYFAETYTPKSSVINWDPVTLRHGRLTAIYSRYDFGGKVYCYVEVKVKRKVKGTNGFFMKEFTAHGNSRHGTNKDFTNIPKYEDDRFSLPIIQIAKDFGLGEITHESPFLT